MGFNMVSLITKHFIDNKNYTDEVRRQKYGTLCSVVGIFLNICLFAFKYFAGVLSGSIAIMADAFNNLSDAGSSIIDLIALGGSSYTNIVNLNNILGSDIGPKSTVVVGVEYTVSGKTYTKEISFIPFKVTEENVVSENFISKILDYAVIECFRFPDEALQCRSWLDGIER
jgi:hypothetical protein